MPAPYPFGLNPHDHAGVTIMALHCDSRRDKAATNVPITLVSMCGIQGPSHIVHAHSMYLHFGLQFDALQGCPAQRGIYEMGQNKVQRPFVSSWWHVAVQADMGFDGTKGQTSLRKQTHSETKAHHGR